MWAKTPAMDSQGFVSALRLTSEYRRKLAGAVSGSTWWTADIVLLKPGIALRK